MSSAGVEASLAARGYASGHGCEAKLNAWCEANCPHAPVHSPLFARFDTNAQQGPPQWRCYAESTLAPDLVRYQQGDTYCTRQVQLVEQLRACIASNAVASAPGGTPSQSSHSQPTAASQPRAAATMPQRSPVPPAPPVPPGCEDSLTECAIWAHYDECAQNPKYMREQCPASCRSCKPSPTSPTSPPPRPPPHPPPSPPPTKPPATAPPRKARPPAFCASPCDSTLGSSRCSGRGSCVEWQGYEWCDCKHSPDTKHIGLQCQLAIRQDAACSDACASHGRCIHGFCECDFGWHGPDCDKGGARPPLTLSVLLPSRLRPSHPHHPRHEPCAPFVRRRDAAVPHQESAAREWLDRRRG